MGARVSLEGVRADLENKFQYKPLLEWGEKGTYERDWRRGARKHPVHHQE